MVLARAATIAYAQAGATLILAGRTVEVKQVYDQIISGGGIEPIVYPVDFEGATEDDFNELANQCDQQFGRLDGLLLNAGILSQRTPVIKLQKMFGPR